MEESVTPKKQKNRSEKYDRSYTIGIALMMAAAALKYYSQYQSSAEINSEEIVPPPGGLIS